jgi:NAD(P)H-hydrate epimerase
MNSFHPSPANMLTPSPVTHWIQLIQKPDKNSRKGQNGKAIVIGGSDLFFAASQWSFTAASRWVDMLFYCSTVENNEILRQAKLEMTDGVVVPRSDVGAYITESDAALIGPGMRRDAVSKFSNQELERVSLQDLSEKDWENDTNAVTAVLLRSFSDKKWIVDAGALQVLQLSWLPQKAILTPHAGEFSQLLSRWSNKETQEKVTQAVADLLEQGVRLLSEEVSHQSKVFIVSETVSSAQVLQSLAHEWHDSTVLLKGRVDIVFDSSRVVIILGGNAGLTKGGTGDVLAGLVLGFAATSSNFESAVVASILLKQSGHDLFLERAEMFNSTDVVEQIPKSFAGLSTHLHG